MFSQLYRKFRWNWDRPLAALDNSGHSGVGVSLEYIIYLWNRRHSGRGGFITHPFLATAMALFERDTDIYRDRDALREDYQPEEIVGRDQELADYQTALQPVINGEQPNNIFLSGKLASERQPRHGISLTIYKLTSKSTTTSLSL